jgi:mRNA interferase RelE/StbE
LQETENPRQRGKGMTANKSGLWRYRIGDYRLVCDIQDGELLVLVLQVAHRSE